MLESEPRKFRQGESAGRPIGGNVSPEPFPQALSKLAALRGLESQVSLGRKLGHVNNGVVSRWFRGENAPNADNFGALLRVFRPDEAELETLVEPWRKLLEDGKAGVGHFADSPVALRIGRKLMNNATTPIGMWIEVYCRSHDITLGNLARSVQLSNLWGQTRDRIGLDGMLALLHKLPQAQDLSDKETASLNEAIAQTIVQREKTVKGIRKF